MNGLLPKPLIVTLGLALVGLVLVIAGQPMTVKEPASRDRD